MIALDLSELANADSEDLSDEEVASAIVTTDTASFVSRAEHSVCPKCGGPLTALCYTLRRRGTDFFARLDGTCTRGDKFRVTFKINWLVTP